MGWLISGQTMLIFDMKKKLFISITSGAASPETIIYW